MALDTTVGGASAESYATLAQAADYHAKRGATTWDAADAEAQEWALRKATTYLDSRYTWHGVKTASTQALDWPRYGVVVDSYLLASDAIPVALRNACCELALKALTEDLLTDVATQHVASVTVGPISRTLSAPKNGGQKRYPLVDALLRDLARGGNGAIELVRA